VNKAQLIENVAEEAKLSTELSKADMTRLVDAVFDVITQALKKRDQVVIVGFGTFSAKDRAGRLGRDPRTGAPLKIAPKTVARFTAGKALKEAVSEDKK